MNHVHWSYHPSPTSVWWWWSTCVCACRCTCMRTSVSTYEYLHAEARELSQVSFLRSCPPCSLRQRPSLAWILSIKPDWLASKFQGSTRLQLPNAGSINSCYHAFFKIWVLGIELRTSYMQLMTVLTPILPLLFLSTLPCFFLRLLSSFISVWHLRVLPTLEEDRSLSVHASKKNVFTDTPRGMSLSWFQFQSSWQPRLTMTTQDWYSWLMWLVKF